MAWAQAGAEEDNEHHPSKTSNRARCELLEDEEAFDVGTSGNRLMSWMMERTDELLGKSTRAEGGGEGDSMGKQSMLSHTVCAPDSRDRKRRRTSDDEMGPDSPMLQ